MDENMSLVPGESSSFFMAVWEWPKLFGDKLARVTVSSLQRPNPKAFDMKAKISGHYVNSILATTDAKQKGFDEALLLDVNGYVAEAPGANFFFEKNNKLFTAPLGNILPGITRATVLELAKEMQIPAEEKFFRIEEVFEADGAFFCGTAAEVSGIASIDNKSFAKNFSETKGAKLQKAYTNLVTKGLVVGG
jgi:branched-chain amino acid aminotransferase